MILTLIMRLFRRNISRRLGRINIVMPNTSGKMKMIDYKKFITIEPGKRSGKPCIRRLRITVYDVLNMLADGMNAKEITDDFPELTEEDILACLAYAADKEHKVAIFA